MENEKLKAKEAERKSKGRARPNTMHTAKVKIVESEIARLQHNILPSEQAPYVPLIVDELVVSASERRASRSATMTIRPTHLMAMATMPTMPCAASSASTTTSRRPRTRSTHVAHYLHN